MNLNILNSVKAYIGISPDESGFDESLLSCINSAIFKLMDIGGDNNLADLVVTPATNWEDMTANWRIIRAITPFVNLHCKLMFDPPASNVLLNALQLQYTELEQRLMFSFQHPDV